MAKRKSKHPSNPSPSKRRFPAPAKAPRQAKADNYRHPESDLALRPDIGTQAQFKRKKPPATYRYDSSLSPAVAAQLDDRARGHRRA